MGMRVTKTYLLIIWHFPRSFLYIKRLNIFLIYHTLIPPLMRDYRHGITPIMSCWKEGHDGGDRITAASFRAAVRFESRSPRHGYKASGSYWQCCLAFPKVYR